MIVLIDDDSPKDIYMSLMTNPRLGLSPNPLLYP
jgi:hypothetical protein